MTALAMVLGMLPMSLGLGDGGEQNAPLGRAVIGGLLSRPSLPSFSFRSSIGFSSGTSNCTNYIRVCARTSDENCTSTAPGRSGGLTLKPILLTPEGDPL